MRIADFEWMASAETRDRNEQRRRQPGQTHECIVCNLPMDPTGAHHAEMLVDGTLIVDEDPTPDGAEVESQGFWPIGPDCLRRLRKR